MTKNARFRKDTDTANQRRSLVEDVTANLPTEWKPVVGTALILLWRATEAIEALALRHAGSGAESGLPEEEDGPWMT